MTQKSSDNLPSDNHHSSDIVYWRRTVNSTATTNTATWWSHNF